MESVGLISKYLPFSGSNNAIVFFRHALALDERRVKFIPFFWTSGKSEVKTPDTLHLCPGRSTSEDPHHKIERGERSGASCECETRVDAITGPPTDVEEVFFAGAHCGMLPCFYPHKIPHSPYLLKTLAVGLSKTVNVPVSPASPFDG